jgi:hypothetical protein
LLSRRITSEHVANGDLTPSPLENNTMFIIHGSKTIVALACLVASGCMTQPFDGQTIAARETRIGVSGSVTRPNDLISVKALNPTTNTWTTLATTRSLQTGNLDAKGITWFNWGASNVTLPLTRQFWASRSTADGSRYVDLRLKANGADGDLETFSQAATNCLVNTFLGGGGGFDFAVQCGTGVTATVSVQCGHHNLACCTSASQNLVCSGSDRCTGGLCVKPPVVVKPSPRDGSPKVDKEASMTAGATCADMDGAPCMGPIASCAAGTTTGPGKIRCANNTPICEVEANSFCTICGGNCGGCAGDSCISDDDCGPGAVCQTSAALPHVCKPIEPTACHRISGYCWLPKDTPIADPPPGAHSQDVCIEAH